jgi:hypothetical protein
MKAVGQGLAELDRGEGISHSDMKAEFINGE